MSNKIVPNIYRSIIDDVIASVQVDFEEYGMDEDILQNLQAKWEAKLLETRVADFARAPQAFSRSPSPGAGPSNKPPTNMSPPAPAPAAGPSSLPQQPAYGLSFPAPGHGLALPGQPSGSGMNGMMPNYGNPMAMNGGGGYDGMSVKADPDDPLRLRGGADAEDIKPQIRLEPNAAGLLPGDEVIDSDLDDSDDELRDEGEEDGEGDVDIVFCVYDKVQRVKNKWKTVFKDGMIHVNGRDYLFAKCNGEFEW